MAVKLKFGLRLNIQAEMGAAVCDRIDQWAEAGVDYVVIQPMPPMEGARFFGERIIRRYA